MNFFQIPGSGSNSQIRFVLYSDSEQGVLEELFLANLKQNSSMDYPF
jgi:hypothetical protein